MGDPTMRFVEYGDLPNAQPYPRRAPKDADVEEDDEIDGSDNPDTEGVHEAIAEELPPPRTRDYTPGHRQVKPSKAIVSIGPSPWERPRDGFTASMTERVPEMRSTKQAGYVKGTTREA